MTQQRFNSVQDLIKAVSETPKDAQDVLTDLDNHRLSAILFALRNKHGLTQKELAQKAGWTQGKVSKLENQVDQNISVGDLSAYCAALGTNLEIGFTNVKPGRLADQVKYHFMKMQAALDQIYRIADGDEEIQRASKPFMDQVWTNLFSALQKCEKSVRNSKKGQKAVESRMIVSSEALEDEATSSHVGRTTFA